MFAVIILSNKMKAFLLCALLGMAVVASAQVKMNHTKSNPTGAIVNTGSDTSYFALPGYYETLVVQPNVIRLSGTLAGTEILQVSVNDSDWVAPAGDTVTLTNVARQVPVILHFAKPDWLFFRIITTGSGTMTAVTTHQLGAKKTSF